MPAIKNIGLAFLALIALTQAATAQVAFEPTIGAFPNGVTLSTTPVVSADRRYVRMSINPQFNVLEGFNQISVPAAVGGLGSGGGGGGLRSVGIPGATFQAGMDGVLSPDSYEISGPSYPPGFLPGASPMATSFLSGDGDYSTRYRPSQGMAYDDPPRQSKTTKPRKPARRVVGKPSKDTAAKKAR